ncbi:glycosyltransferase family 1 protein [Fibrella sp. WM1]|uniref:glycosyltransferase family 1 protein n=1 Tax=Fibrella musci TaxID=3242485 RepID=UPI003522C79C
MKVSDFPSSSSNDVTSSELSSTASVSENHSPKSILPAASTKAPASSPESLICFSHLRWNFVYQRPQHLMSRASRQMNVYFLEEPIWGNELRVEVRQEDERLKVIVPHIPHGTPHQEVLAYLRRTVDQLIESERIAEYVAWYYTPMALDFSDHLTPTYTVYDCMDELSAFLGAPRELIDMEAKLMTRADQVFTGGYSLYEAKRTRHDHAHAFPSSIDFAHFAKARQRDTDSAQADPTDQAHIPHPRIGFSGVIDERFDVQLLRELANRRPEWQFVLLGPIVKIDPATLPKNDNIHYLGMKNYKELPTYFGGWDVAMLPFALNASTRYISPTKTPEYLAAGLPVVSTPIRDVVRTYGEPDFVQIAATVDAFDTAIEKALNKAHPTNWAAIDQFLSEHSWDKTWEGMESCIVKNN